MASGEFDLIERFFAPLAAPEGLALGDDAAVFSPPPAHQLVVTSDCMVAGVHFLPSDPPGSIGVKILAVNLSDLAAMGAAPLGYTLALALPETIGDDWLADFAAGLGRAQQQGGIGLFGGDTVSTPGPLSLTVTAFGSIAGGMALRRNGAAAGDLICVSGTLGDAALGLYLLRHEGQAVSPEDRAFLSKRYREPSPRNALGTALCGVAHACADISDGLFADLGHICGRSGLGAEVDLSALPRSAAFVRSVAACGLRELDFIAAGDDYELLFTLPLSRRAEVAALARRGGVDISVIGRMRATAGIRARDADGRLLDSLPSGWVHR